VLFIGFELWLAPIIVKRHGHWLDRLKIPNPGFVVALIVMLSMAALSEAIGLAGIVGAFFAGMMFAETEDRWELSRQTQSLYEWLVPYFFVVTGMLVDPTLFRSPSVLIPGLVLVAIAILTKVVGCGLGAWGLNWKRMLAIGIGMVPRGEVGLIIASTGLAMHVIGDATYAMIILVVVLTTVVVPPFLAIVFPWATGAIPHPVDLDTDEVIF
jgi:Kef-type K+ transport system membrane component KefB